MKALRHADLGLILVENEYKVARLPCWAAGSYLRQSLLHARVSALSKTRRGVDIPRLAPLVFLCRDLPDRKVGGTPRPSRGPHDPQP